MAQVGKIAVSARWVASPEPAVGVFTPAGTCPGRLRRHFVIGYADPGQNPSDVRFGSSRVRGRGPGRAGHDFLTAGRRGSAGQEPVCKPICKPDAAGQLETGETWKDRVDFAAQVGRGRRDDQRLPETPETHVARLITQRSRVQIPPPLLSSRSEASSDHGRGLLHVPCAPNCARGL